MRNLKYIGKDWYNLQWSPWVHFRDKDSFKLFPNSPGVYRIKPVGRAELFYIGQTGRTLRERLRSLIANSLQDAMPYNDPHTAAPSLWVWIDAENLQFEASAAAVDLPRPERMGLESCLLWLYRCESSKSTACNYGRFHPNYEKSRDRNSGKRGSMLPDGKTNPAGSKSIKPLLNQGSYREENWMGLNWQKPLQLNQKNLQNIPAGKGIYIILNEEILYIGQSANIKARLTAHCRKDWGESPVIFKYYSMPDETLPHQLKEWENDLIGAYYYLTKHVPKYQFAGH